MKESSEKAVSAKIELHVDQVGILTMPSFAYQLAEKRAFGGTKPFCLQFDSETGSLRFGLGRLVRDYSDPGRIRNVVVMDEEVFLEDNLEIEDRR